MFKSQLQEYTQKASLPLPVYETASEGPAHDPKFKATVIVNGARYDCTSNFHSIKAAEQSAAQVALEDLLKKLGQEKDISSRAVSFLPSLWLGVTLYFRLMTIQIMATLLFSDNGYECNYFW